MNYNLSISKNQKPKMKRVIDEEASLIFGVSEDFPTATIVFTLKFIEVIGS